MFAMSIIPPPSSAASLLPALLTFLGVIITAVATVAAVYLKHWLDSHTNKQIQLDVLEAARSMRRRLNEVFESLDCARVLLVRIDVREGETLQNKDAAHYISIVEEIVKTALPSAAKVFQVYRADSEYKDKIIKPMLQDTTRHRIYVSDLSAGFLRNHYEASGIVCSDLLYLHQTTRNLWFVSVNHAEDHELTPAYLTALDTLQHKLQNILAKYPEAGM